MSIKLITLIIGKYGGVGSVWSGQPTPSDDNEVNKVYLNLD